MAAVIPDDVVLVELTADQSPPSAITFTPEGGKATIVYKIEVATLQELKDQISELLGSTSFEVGDGRIQRTLPKAHPQFADEGLYVSAVGPVQGIGIPVFTESEPDAEEIDAIPYYALYPQYAVKAEFATRPYQLMRDDQIQTRQGEYTTPGNSIVPYEYVTEWWRYTDHSLEPQGEFVTAQQGQYLFRTTLGGPGATDPNNTPYPAMPRMFMPNQIVKLRWFQVPYRYVTSPKSLFDRWIGFVNQDSFDGGFGECEPGSLLYLGYNVQRFPPPFPDVDEFFGVPSIEKLCNIEFNFLKTRRVGVGVPSPNNGNYIADHHNLMPWLMSRNFYYVSAQNADETPSFLSFPLNAMFSDPDSGLIDGLIDGLIE